MENSGKFIRSVSLFRGDYLLRHEINADHKTITLVYGGRTLTDEDKAQLKKRAAEFGLGNVILNYQQGLNFSDLSTQLSETERLKFEINRLSLLLQQSARQQDSVQQRSYTGRIGLKELRALFPLV